jgi:DNA polymerase III epsilon subunit-like protein
MIYSGVLELESVSLSVLCDYFGVKIKAHDAMSDIKASREIIQKMQKLLK